MTLSTANPAEKQLNAKDRVRFLGPKNDIYLSVGDRTSVCCGPLNQTPLSH